MRSAIPSWHQKLSSELIGLRLHGRMQRVVHRQVAKFVAEGFSMYANRVSITPGLADLMFRAQVSAQ